MLHHWLPTGKPPALISGPTRCLSVSLRGTHPQHQVTKQPPVCTTETEDTTYSGGIIFNNNNNIQDKSKSTQSCSQLLLLNGRAAQMIRSRWRLIKPEQPTLESSLLREEKDMSPLFMDTGYDPTSPGSLSPEECNSNTAGSVSPTLSLSIN